ncbi:MAG: CapA family protein [Anaerolineae bacterium]|nr:CapA family protein [Anaerolineae bacterium]
MARQTRLNRAASALIALMLAGCAVPVVPAAPAAEAPAAAASATPEVPGLTAPPSAQPAFFVQPGTPPEIVERISPVLAQAGLVQTENADAADLTVMPNPGPDAALSAQWVYAVATPFPTVPDGIEFGALQSYWQTGDASRLPFSAPPKIVVTSDAATILITLLGAPYDSNALLIASPADAADIAWANQPALGVLAFESLEPRWKVLALDGRSVLDRGLDLSAYPLTIPVGVIARTEAGRQAAESLRSSRAWPTTNRDPAKIVNVVLTGTTAIARATAMQVELKGIDFPAANILPFFADADILHTSNESSYAVDCPEPDWFGEPTFCSQKDYFTLLQNIGLDIVDLTGNHIKDWGDASLLYTLDLYDTNSLPYYGGGRDLADSRTPRILTTPDGTRFAFVGCNSAGPFPVWATDATPGAAPCDDWSAITAQVSSLKANGQADVVIVTLQYLETPSYEATGQQIADFDALANAGADIVSGSQAHQPQGFGFPGGRFVHYGIGNLFFDQMDYIENRQMFADKHVFYEGRHISTILFTGMNEEWAQPRPMTAEERADFLATIFDVSAW